MSANAHDKERDEITGTETTGHVWDGIRELNTPLPKWWLYTFYVTVAFSVVWMVLYPAIPYYDGEWKASEGTAGYSQRTVVAGEIADARAAQKQYLDRIEAADFQDIMADEALLNFASQGGRAAFGDNCAPCHGAGAQGFTGFPNLNDDAWIWGGTLSDIYTTIQHGIRWEDDPETRLSDMPAFLDDEILDRDQIHAVVEFVLSLSGNAENTALLADGAAVFEQECALCHGAAGMGDKTLGAPNLTDAIWLYGGSRDTLFATVAHSRRGVMPSWVGRLDEATIKQLTLYVHGLGGGETTVADQAEDMIQSR
ncbi:cytochrome-c oxidase, cbb3-type subunit III [Eilatimonas milleporae]|uniref:Cbb3-type cytochrome c oxidase subunit n=1 Tax=Eilatimonas milleporae TaxID=911205 RepID=A0A3M0CGV7_9PROT|nr:cytochrome-c oxidase, cbb3-type subunit III [Eilatimonas milleporae]RMB07760.1 cytochrome c oxidase cbb3-type subunit 3 [Eilatimonas milleporae]